MLDRVDELAEHEARAQYLLLSHAVDRIADAARQLDAPMILVKGAALARTVYPKPWLRPMGDVDVLVLERDRERVLAALDSAGFEVAPAPLDRRFSASLLGETATVTRVGGAAVLVEVHHRLDKIARRPIDYEGIAARAQRLPGSPLFVPCPVDHALLVILHAALSEFCHPVAWQDLDLLFGAGVDGDMLVRRAHDWELATATHLALAALRARGSKRIPASLLQRFRPRPWGRALDRLYPGRERRSGFRWLLAQAPLHDDLLTWLRNLAYYSRARAFDRLGASRRRPSAEA